MRRGLTEEDPMAIKFEKIEPGMRLADVHKGRMGNTTMSRYGCWWVDVVSVDREKRAAVVRWNGNRPTLWDARRLERLYREDKLPKKCTSQGKW
jgi:hypothetical protein